MELHRIDNLWKFLGIKNNLTVNNFLTNGVNYQFVRGGLEITHHYNPRMLHHSNLMIVDRNFQEDLKSHQYVCQKHRFGTKFKQLSPASTLVFFPKELLTLNHQFDLDIEKDRSGHYKVKISPFAPKDIYEILDSVNLITRSLWKRNFFSEGIRN